MEILGSFVEMCLARNSRIAAARDSTEPELDISKSATQCLRWSSQ